MRSRKQAFQRRILLAAVPLLIVLLFLSGASIRSRRMADRTANTKRAEAGSAALRKEGAALRKEAADANEYAADMGLIQHDWEKNDIGHLRELLEATRARGKGTFEWGYWNRLCRLDLLTLPGHNAGVWSVAVSPDGKRIVTGSADHTARIWDAQNGKELLTFAGHTDTVVAVAFSPDSRAILTGSGDRSAKLWDAQTGKELLSLQGHGSGVTAALFFPDGKRIVTGSADNSAKIWYSENTDTPPAWRPIAVP